MLVQAALGLGARLGYKQCWDWVPDLGTVLGLGVRLGYRVRMGCQTWVQTVLKWDVGHGHTLLGWGIGHRYKQCWDGMWDMSTNNVGMGCQTQVQTV